MSHCREICTVWAPEQGTLHKSVQISKQWLISLQSYMALNRKVLIVTLALSPRYIKPIFIFRQITFK